MVERALQILPFLKTYIIAAKQGKVAEPSNKSFKAAKNISGDDLFLTKLNFFSHGGKRKLSSLKKKSDEPMLPFITEDLSSLLRGLLEFILL